MKLELEKLKESGHKVTPPRLAALEVLGNSSEHISIEELHRRIKERCPRAGLATTYRTLELLRGLDLITSLDLGGGKKRYEMRTGDHSHLICHSCSKVTEIKSDFSGAAKEMISQKYGFKVADCQLEYHGICIDCANEKGRG